jgi:hypothetical protein
MAHVIAATDGLPDVHAALVQAFIHELERLAAAAVADDELRGTLDTMRANMGTSRSAAQCVTHSALRSSPGRTADTCSSAATRSASASSRRCGG